MKSNIHNISKDKNYSCAVFSAIFACKIREATSSILTESAAPLCRSMNRVPTHQCTVTACNASSLFSAVSFTGAHQYFKDHV